MRKKVWAGLIIGVMLLASGCTGGNLRSGKITSDPGAAVTEQAELTATPSPTPSAVTLSDFIGKRVADVRERYGDGFTYMGYSGTSIMAYDDEGMTFFLESYSETISDGAYIIKVSSSGMQKVAGRFDGSMTYSEVLQAAGSAVERDEYYYNALDDRWERTVQISYQDYLLEYVWYNEENPEHVKCTYVECRRK